MGRDRPNRQRAREGRKWLAEAGRGGSQGRAEPAVWSQGGEFVAGENRERTKSAWAESRTCGIATGRTRCAEAGRGGNGNLRDRGWTESYRGGSGKRSNEQKCIRYEQQRGVMDRTNHLNETNQMTQTNQMTLKT